ncbi:vesicle-fusing ATPase [Nematocida displodere]|uniref:Vesicular-fusion protein SEC18 n=1 Tax=Nematocida displodere TaxID=1805483 RepID=A0A177ECG2_9MICR|nr:vesicle-fusing ATPase [Nematocida displodere]
MKYTVVKMQKPIHAYTNRVYISGEYQDTFCAINGYVFRVEKDESLNTGTLALSQIQRDLIRAEEGSVIEVVTMSISSRSVISKVAISLSIKTKKGEHPRLSKDTIEKAFLSKIEGIPLTRGQQICLIIGTEDMPDDPGAKRALLFICTIEEIETVDKAIIGVVRPNTELEIGAHPGISLVGAGSELKISSEFNSQELEIGGLEKEFGEMFRRAFLQRTYPPEFIQKMGITHIKGIMLYGPPGTGKTLIARKMSTRLNTAPPKIVNGPEILNKYVGQSEENIRKLFEDAENDYKKYGDASPLHVIIFDEIDAICKSRGSSNGVGDQVVNQLLSKLDGVECLNNILVIGMTNRLDLIDDALLRPGRFEIHIEIALPDEHGRLEILQIHTNKMEKNCFLGADVEMPVLASKSKNFTGAEITALVKSAASFALERSQRTKEEVVIGMKDFEQALEETVPAFGVSKSLRLPEPLYHYPSAKKAIAEGEKMVQRLKNKENGKLSQTLSLMLSGHPGVGKTTIAEIVAKHSEIPFIRVISPRDLVGKEEHEKVIYIKKTFKDAYRSSESIVVLDDIEGLMDYVAIGPRFSNSVLQAIKIFAKNQAKYRVLVIGTTADASLMEESGILRSFDEHVTVSPISKEDKAWFSSQTSIACNINQTIREIIQ